MGFFSKEELRAIGFKNIGEDVLISEKASIYSPNLISIGSHVRIDDFCILSGEIILGNYIHIAAYSALYGKFGIEMQDYTGLSPRCTIFSASDDFSGNYLISPMVPDEYTNVKGGKVTIKNHSQLGAGCIVLPDITIDEGVAVGAMSLVNHSLKAWSIYYGIPARKKKERLREILNLSQNLQSK